MKIDSIISGLEKNKMVFQALFDLENHELILFKKKPNSWCYLEIVCHLIDEEVEDFRARVKHALHSIEQPLKSISPKTWPLERNYLDQDFKQKVSQFLEEREVSTNWLRSLNHEDWTNELVHPDLGKISAKKFLLNWLAHDYLHIRQLNALKRSFLQETSDEDLTYAGNW